MSKHSHHELAAKHFSAAAHHSAEAQKAHVAGGLRNKVNHHAHIAYGHALTASEHLDLAAKHHAKHHSKSHPENPKHNPAHRSK
jgi:hypothetical protein